MYEGRPVSLDKQNRVKLPFWAMTPPESFADATTIVRDCGWDHENSKSAPLVTVPDRILLLMRRERIIAYSGPLSGYDEHGIRCSLLDDRSLDDEVFCTLCACVGCTSAWHLQCANFPPGRDAPETFRCPICSGNL